MGYLTKANISLPDGIANITLNFDEGVNFLSGENGTGKSKTLEYLKNNINSVGTIIETSDSSPIDGSKIAFYNPKRNSQKKEVEGLVEQMQREGRSAKTLRGLVNQNYSDQNFVEYPSLAELYALSVDDISKSKDMSPSSAVQTVKDAMKLVIGKVMPDIEVEADWNKTSNQATLSLLKFGSRLKPSQLSVGENEIIALALSIYLFRESHDLYLIDEPEVHLNWSLEQKLFDFLEWFAKENSKQVIVVTHSPIVFEQKFKKRTQFFNWENGRVTVTTEPSDSITRKLASRVAATFQTLETVYDKTFFVEDKAHKLVVERIALAKSKNVNVMPLNSRANVISLHKAAGSSLKDSVFMVDGDNEDMTNGDFTGNLFALEKYCIENYILNPKLLSKISKRTAYNTEAKIKKLILVKTTSYNNQSFKKQYKAHIIVADKNKKSFFNLIDSMDGSRYLDGMKIYQQLGFSSKQELIEVYIDKAAELKILDNIFPEITDRLN